jgi:hypothetical protein
MSPDVRVARVLVFRIGAPRPAPIKRLEYLCRTNFEVGVAYAKRELSRRDQGRFASHRCYSFHSAGRNGEGRAARPVRPLRIWDSVRRSRERTPMAPSSRSARGNRRFGTRC